MLPTSIGILQAQSASAPAPSFAFNPAWDLTSSDALGNLGAKLSAYTGVILTPPASNPFVPTQNEIVVAEGTPFTMATGTTLTSFTVSMQKGLSPTKHKLATLSYANPNLNIGQYDHIIWQAHGNYNLGIDVQFIPMAIGGGGGGGDPDEGDLIDPIGDDPIGGGIIGGGGLGGGGLDDDLGGGGLGGGGLVPDPEEVNLLSQMNVNTGAFNSPLYWLWIEGGLVGGNAAGQTIKAVFEATNSAGTTISTTRTWVTQ